MLIFNKEIILGGIGVEPSSYLGVLIIIIGLLVSIGIPILMITKGKKD